MPVGDRSIREWCDQKRAELRAEREVAEPDGPLWQFYTFGFEKLARAKERLNAIVNATGAIVVDIRLTPTSRGKVWSEPELRKRYGHRGYRYVPELGCLSSTKERARGVVRFVNLDRGLFILGGIMAETRRLVLFCSCPDVALCHRRVLVEQMEDECSVQVEHLGASMTTQEGLSYD